jgi:hypothetical protein
MFIRPLPSREVLQSLFIHCRQTGTLIHQRRSREQFSSIGAWKSWNTKYAEKEAGTLNKAGYRYTYVHGKLCLNHRIIYKMETGEDIDGFLVDHKDIVPSNNYADNLQRVTSAQNLSKMSEKKRAGTSIYKGVSYDKARKKWASKIQVNYKLINLGRFPDELSAHKCYCLAAIKHFGEFANFGKSSPFTRDNLSATPAA